MTETQMDGGGEPTPFPFTLIPTHKPEQSLENVRYALSLGLPEIKQCAAHDEIMSIAGGGPSLADTYKDLTGYVAACNGSLAYLIEKGVTSQMCGVCDPSEHMADIVEAVPGVAYFVASCVHPKVFDKLMTEGCTVYLWHLHPLEGLDALLRAHYPDGWVQIPGGCTMGLRWITLGYHLGFRKFHLHGLDSSFRETSHAYPDHQDEKEWLNIDGYKTRVNFIGQVNDFIGLMEDGREGNVEPFEVTMFGDGLLQTRYIHWLKKNPPFEWPADDVNGKRYITAEARSIPEFLKYIPNRGMCIQAGGNVGVYPRRLARAFASVHTFEPSSVNFSYLVKNISGYKNIITHHEALGETNGMVSVKSHEEGNSGAVHVEEGFDVYRRTIDALELDKCDLIWLDIEGFEELALKGAANTIDKFKPAVIVEEKSILAEMHGLEASGAMNWLKEREYYRVTKNGNDCLYVYGGP